MIETEEKKKLFLKANSLFSLWMSHFFFLVNRNEKQLIKIEADSFILKEQHAGIG